MILTPSDLEFWFLVISQRDGGIISTISNHFTFGAFLCPLVSMLTHVWLDLVSFSPNEVGYFFLKHPQKIIKNKVFFLIFLHIPIDLCVEASENSSFSL